MRPIDWLLSHKEHDEDRCLEWPFSRTGSGYPLVTNGRNYRARAHRVMCELVHGHAPDGQPEAAHNCGNKLCVNPSHLRWASRKENEADKEKHNTKPLGSRCSTAILDENQVRQIRAAHTRGHGQYLKLGKQFGVSPKTIQKIVLRENWRWLDD